MSTVCQKGRKWGEIPSCFKQIIVIKENSILIVNDIFIKFVFRNLCDIELKKIINLQILKYPIEAHRYYKRLEEESGGSNILILHELRMIKSRYIEY